MVMVFHFFNNNVYKEHFVEIFPTWLVNVLNEGWLGVHVFFVISGFVIANSVARYIATPKFALIFGLRRGIRLEPPYWFTIFVWVALTFLSNIFLERTLGYPPLEQIISHIFYAQNILFSLNLSRYPDIIPVFWTLCLEVQFYLFFVIQLAAIRLIRKPKGASFCGVSVNAAVIILLVEALITTYLMNQSPVNSRHLPYSSPWFYLWWHMFAGGALLYFAHAKLIQAWPVCLLIAMQVGASFLGTEFRSDMLAAAITETIFLLAINRNAMSKWLNGPIIQFLGKISYSLYLIHFVTGSRVLNLLHRFTPDNLLWAIITVIFVFVLSIAAAAFMFYFIEKPSIDFGIRVKKKYVDPL